MTIRLSAKLIGQRRAIELFAGTDRDAARAMQTALRDAARKARSVSAKSLAARSGAPMKVFRKRLQAFQVKPRKAVRFARLWLGTTSPPGGADHKKVQRYLLKRNPGARLTARGDVVTGRGPGLTFHRLTLDGAETIMSSAATDAMTNVYVPKLIRDFERRMKRRR